MRRICDFKRVEIAETQACPGHIRMLMKIPPKIGVSSFM